MAERVRVLFLGNDAWSVPTLEALASAADVDLATAITNPPRPAGRGSKLRPTAVAEAAARLGVPVVETDGVRTGAGWDALERLDPDAVVVVAYGELLTPQVLDVPRLGTVNLHFSLLPRWRGAAPVQRAILEGDEVTGVSVMLLDEGLDTGPVLDRAEVTVGDDDTGTLGERLATLGAPMVVEAVRRLEAGTARPVSQDHAAATYAAKLTADERTIDWRHAAASIVRRVRAFAPAPGATTTFRGAPLKVLRAEIRAVAGWMLGARVAAEGEIGRDADGVPRVAAGDGQSVALLEVAPAGRARMSGADWARGARLQAGERCT
jgi:methionyl-tRNA formyltransferase